MDVRRLPMARYLGVDPLPQPVIEIGTGVNDGVGVIGVGVLVDAHDADAQLVLAGGVLRRAADALLATDVTWSSRGRPWRGSHATMTPTQLANQLLDRGFRTQHLRFMSGLGYLRHQQEHHWIAPPRSYFGAPAGESPFYRTQLHCVICGRCLCGRCLRDAIHANPRDDGSESDVAASSASGDDDDESESDAPASSASGGSDDGSDSDAPASSAPGDDEEPGSAGPPTDGGSSSDDASGDETHLSPRRSRSRSPRHARRRVTTSQ